MSQSKSTYSLAKGDAKTTYLYQNHRMLGNESGGAGAIASAEGATLFLIPWKVS